jgi:hypothetical protein
MSEKDKAAVYHDVRKGMGHEWKPINNS